jgi:hypothetical protein
MITKEHRAEIDRVLDGLIARLRELKRATVRPPPRPSRRAIEGHHGPYGGSARRPPFRRPCAGRTDYIAGSPGGVELPVWFRLRRVRKSEAATRIDKPASRK